MARPPGRVEAAATDMSFGRPDDQLRYGSYLKIPELLTLQRTLTPEHDEVQFIVVHQVFELWFRLILHELDAVMHHLGRREAGDLPEATRLLQRVATIQGVLVKQLDVLETMRPADFLRFRDVLKPASGFQSAQFREVEFLSGLKQAELMERCDADSESMSRLRRRFEGPTLRERFAETATARGFSVTPQPASATEFDASVSELARLYGNPALDRDLYDLAEALLDVDEGWVLWRSRHVRMVERVIGGKIGTGAAATGAGYEGTRYLERTLSKKAFPELWDVRTRLGEPSP